MSSSKDLQTRIVQTLQTDSNIPASLPVVPWKKKSMKSNMEATLAAQTGTCIFVPRPKPTSALQGTPFVFFDGYECRVQIIEIPSANEDGPFDLDDLIDAVALALHWQPKSVDSPLAGILAHPLYLSPRPVETAEGIIAVPGFEHDGQIISAAEVIFTAVLQINS